MNKQIQKTQIIRVIDVGIIGPALMILGTRKRKYLIENIFLFGVGFFTTTYNLYNLVKQQRIENDSH